MSKNVNALLQQAYTHIENDELESAREILVPLLQEDAANPHLWWLYTHAVQDVSLGQAALERVLELDPQYPGARELKADVLEAQSKDPDLIALEAHASGAEESRTPIEIDDWEDLQPAAETNGKGSTARWRYLMAAALLIVLAGGAIVLSGAVDLNELLAGLLPSPAPNVIIVSEATHEPTSLHDAGEAMAEPEAATEMPVSVVEIRTTESRTGDGQATDAAPTQDLTMLETAQPTTASAASATPSPTIASGAADTARFVRWLADEITDFTVDQATSGTLPTRLGNTLVVAVCAVPGLEYSSRLDTVLTTVASRAEDLPEEIEAVAAGLLNCDDDEASLRIIGASRATLLAFANEEIESKEFQSAWQPLS